MHEEPNAFRPAIPSQRFADSRAQDILGVALDREAMGEAALVTSFGTESAVLLHMAAEIRDDVEVLFVDTLKHFPETLEYKSQLTERLGLKCVRDIKPDADDLLAKDPKGIRWSYDPDQCCALRKVTPLETMLSGFPGWITGRKGFQNSEREAVAPFEQVGEQWRANPLYNWSKQDLEDYFEKHDLPRHPLEAEGYLSVGCAPCTSKVLPGEDIRAGRWRAFDKSECGIHGLPGKGG